MMSDFSNVYDDEQRAQAYATLGFPNTYYLAFRDLPRIIQSHVTGQRALDFGCGTGRSTRFLSQLGLAVIGVDIAASMIAQAVQADPEGDYRLVADGEFTCLPGSFDLILSAFAFDNILGEEWRAELLRRLSGLLAPSGRIIILGSTPEIYLHEWASFSTADYPENAAARSGQQVRIKMTDVPDGRPVNDLIWFHEDYLRLFGQAGLEILAEVRPLGQPDEPYTWISELTVAPWVIYVLGREDGAD